MIGKSKAWALTLLLVVLLMGGAAGAAIDRMLVSDRATAENRDRPGDDRDHRRSYIEWLAAELTLTDDQRANIEVLVEQYREQVSAQWKEMRPKFEEFQTQLRAEIRDILTEEQLEAYEALLAKESERRHSRRGRQ
jgi:Spy/CpxP family protein refolding chaperone